MATDLQTFLAQVEREHPNWIERVREPVDIQTHEATAYLQHLENRGEQRMVLFENVRTLNGEPSPFPLLYNAFVSRELCALAIGLDPNQSQTELSREFARRELTRGHLNVVSPAEAPCKEVVWRGKDADVGRLPMGMHHALDVAPYLTMTCIMKALSGDFYDITFNKNMYQGPQRMSVSAHAHHHLDNIVKEYEREGRRAPIVIVLGHHPAFYLASCCMTPYGNNDYETLAAFLDGGLRLVPSETWGKDFLVPADSEIIIEGEVPPGVREYQNPFGEIAGYYQERMQMPVMDVTAITFHRGAIMQGIFPGHQEHFRLGAIGKEGSVYNLIKAQIPGVQAVHLPMSGCGRFTCYISLKKEFANEPRKAAMAAFFMMPNLKCAIVVDDDVDVFTEREVMWAVATRTWWDEDVQIIDRVQAFRGWLGHAVGIIDATKPLDREFPIRNAIPEDAMERAARLLKEPAAVRR